MKPGGSAKVGLTGLQVSLCVSSSGLLGVYTSVTIQYILCGDGRVEVKAFRVGTSCQAALAGRIDTVTRYCSMFSNLMHQSDSSQVADQHDLSLLFVFTGRERQPDLRS